MLNPHRFVRYFYPWLLGLLVAQSVSPVLAVTPQIMMGAQHSLAMKSDGTLVTWGSDSTGQLGVGRDLYFTIPQRVPASFIARFTLVKQSLPYIN